MLRQRTITAIFMVPTVFGVIYIGTWVYALFILAIMTIAGLEYERLAGTLNIPPARGILLIGIWSLMLVVGFLRLEFVLVTLTVLVVGALAWHLVKYERGQTNTTQHWAGTVLGIVYLGLLGGYLVAIRNLPNGLWWTLIILSAIMVADTGAYLVGRAIGRHKMVPRLSPKKTWEGYFGGLVLGVLITGGLAWLWQNFGQDAELITWQHGMLIALLISILGPIGDLGISMLKREANLKDTGAVLLGMGGILDRVDSWLLAAAIGYFYITLAVLN